MVMYNIKIKMKFEISAENDKEADKISKNIHDTLKKSIEPFKNVKQIPYPLKSVFRMEDED